MFDTGEKQIKLSDAAEVREADVTPEKSTIVKGRERAVSVALAGQGGQRCAVQRVTPAYRGTALALRSRGTAQRCPLSIKPICCLSAAWSVKPGVPFCLQRHQTPLGFSKGSCFRALSALGSGLSSPQREDPCHKLPLPWLQQAIWGKFTFLC